jgi:hypothetical protein
VIFRLGSAAGRHAHASCGATIAATIGEAP